MDISNEDHENSGDCTPLMEASIAGHVDIVNLLISHGANVNAQSTSGNTPLMYGCASGHEDVVKTLLAAGANVEDHNENGHTPLMEAASGGHVSVAKLLLEHGAGINTHSNEFKESALTLACYKGHLNMVKFLLEAGADQEHKTDEMHTALMEASMDGHVEVARLLLDSGAQVNMPSDSFESPLTLAACGGHVDLAMLLIERGANIEEVNDEGYTPLMEAAREGHEEMVALLLSQGANINAQTDETQETALTLACCGGFLEVVDFLVKAGANIELGASTPLMEAAQEGHLDISRYLLEMHANVHAQTQTGDTALTYACENGHTDVVDLLLQFGADMEHESEGGRTPLMKACRAGHLNTIQFLISRNANVNRQTTNNDHTPLSLACAGGHISVVELLLSQSADPFHKLKDNSTMLIEAAKGGHTNVVQLLLDYPHSIMIGSTQNTCMSSLTQSADIQVSNDYLLNQPSTDETIISSQCSIVPQTQSTSNSLKKKYKTENSETIEAITLEQLQHVQDKLIFCTKSYTNDENCSSCVNYTVSKLVENSTSSDICLQTDSKETSKEETNMHKAHILEELQRIDQSFFNQEQILNSADEYNVGEIFLSKTKCTSKNNANMKDEQSVSELNISTGQNLYDCINETVNSVVEDSSTSFIKNPQANKFYIEGFKEGVKLEKQRLLKEISCLQQNQLQLPVPISAAKSATMTENSISSSPVTVMTVPVSAVMSKTNGSYLSSEVCDNEQHNVNLPHDLYSREGEDSHSKIKIAHKKDKSLKKNVPSLVMSKLQQQHLALMAGLSSTDFQKFLEKTRPHCVQQVYQLQQLNQQLQLQLDQVQQNPSTDADGSLNSNESNCLFSQIAPSSNTTKTVIGMEDHVQGSVNNADNKVYDPTNVGSNKKGEQGHTGIHVAIQDDVGIDNFLDKKTITTSCHKGKKKKLMVVQQSSMPRNINASHTLIETSSPSSSHLSETSSCDPKSCSSVISPEQVPPIPFSCIDVDSETDSNHDTALTLACAGGHDELVELLITRGADIEHRDKKGFTPLILAATAGHQKVVEILLNHGADIEAQSERTKDTPLSLACSGGRFEVVDILLNKGANKEHRNVSDYTPLSLAASGGYVNIIKLLLSQGAEINSRTGSKLGISPLMLAAMNGHTAAVKLLLDMGSDINAQIETNRNTALTLACFQGRHEVVSLLLDRKANVEHRAKTGLTPLMEAASGGYVDVGRVLLNKGADVNATPVPSSRDTALTISADKGHCRFVELLLSKGTQIEVKNKKGNSPLWLAANGGHLNVVDLLYHAGADIDSQDNRKVSCLMAAFRKGHVKVVKWMVNHVTQFPSDQEMMRYISTLNEKELLERCNECVKIIKAAKETQAAKANKNASILLEELDMEKNREESKKAAAARRRERKRKKKLEKKEEKRKLQEHTKKNTVSFDNQRPQENCDTFYNRNIRKSSNETIETVSAKIHSSTVHKNNCNESDLWTPSVELENPNFNKLITEKIVNLKQSSTEYMNVTQKSADNTNVSCSTQQDWSQFGVDNIFKHPADREDFKETGNEVHSNKRNKNTIKSQTVIDTNSAVNSGIHFSKQLNKRDDSMKDGWKEVVRKGQGEDSTKHSNTSFRLKKVYVPHHAISRVIGRGGNNINMIRSFTGAHIEVEKQNKSQGERFITIKGSIEATRKAYVLIGTMIKDPDIDIFQIIPKTKDASGLMDKIPSSSTASKVKMITSKLSSGSNENFVQTCKQSPSRNSFSTAPQSAIHDASTIKTEGVSNLRVSLPMYSEKNTVVQNTPLNNTKTTMSYTRAIMTVGPMSRKGEGNMKQTITNYDMALTSLDSLGQMHNSKPLITENIEPFSNSKSSSSHFTPRHSIQHSLNQSNNLKISPKSPLSYINISTAKTWENPVAHDKCEYLPNDHSVLLRKFRSSRDNNEFQKCVTPDQIILKQEFRNQAATTKVPEKCTVPTVNNHLEYSLFNDTFSNVTQQSMWGKDNNNEKNIDFASIAGSGISMDSSIQSINQYSEVGSSKIDISKAPGYRGTNMSQSLQKIEDPRVSIDTFTNVNIPITTIINTDASKNYIDYNNPSSASSYSSNLTPISNKSVCVGNYTNTIQSYKENVASAINRNDLTKHERSITSEKNNSNSQNLKNSSSMNSDISPLPYDQISHDYCSIPSSKKVHTAVSMSRLNPQAPDFNSSLHFNKEPRESIFDQVASLSPSVHSNALTSVLSSAEGSSAPLNLGSYNFSNYNVLSEHTSGIDCQTWSFIPSETFLTHNNRVLDQSCTDNCFSPTEIDLSNTVYTSPTNITTTDNPSHVISEVPLENRKTPRPIGTERSWKNQFPILTTESDVNSMNWSFIKENKLHPWSNNSNLEQNNIYISNATFKPTLEEDKSSHNFQDKEYNN